MLLWDRVVTLVRAHWHRALLPAGALINAWGNRLYDTPARTIGWVLFVGGFALAFWGCRSWGDLIENWPLPKRLRRWAGDRWREPKRQRGWEALKLTLWGLAVAAVALCGERLFNGIVREPYRVAQHVGSARVLLYAWLFLPLWGKWAEPTSVSMDEALERLKARIQRAMISRSVANAAGIYFVGVIIYAYVINTRPTLLGPLAVTLGGTAIAMWHKTWKRLRKLSTQLHGNVSALERDLAMVHGGGDEQVREKQDAARRSWNKVQLDLLTGVDTGYALMSVSFLPIASTRELGMKVEEAVAALAKDEDAAADVLDVLAKLRRTCSERIDSVA